MYILSFIFVSPFAGSNVSLSLFFEWYHRYQVKLFFMFSSVASNVLIFHPRYRMEPLSFWENDFWVVLLVYFTMSITADYLIHNCIYVMTFVCIKNVKITIRKMNKSNAVDICSYISNFLVRPCFIQCDTFFRHFDLYR